MGRHNPKGGHTLTIRVAKNPDYYESPEFALDDYYAEHDNVPGRWVGHGARTLRLDTGPERGDLDTLLSGRSPRTGETLQGGRGRTPTNAGFDLTFTAPKSVSVLLAVGDERVQAAVLAAHERGVQAGLDYLERHECFARRGTDGVNVIPAEGFVGAAYTHEMARSGDPHLHTHVVIANRVHAADGRWTAPDMRSVYAAAKTAGTIAEAVMRDELTRLLGVRWRDVQNGTAEIDGVLTRVLEHFSQRHKEIADLAVVRGWVTEQGIAAIQRETRDRKPQIDRDVAQALWRARASEHGFGDVELATVVDRSRTRRSRSYASELGERLAGPNGLTRQESTFTRRAVLQEFATAFPEGIAAKRLERMTDDFLARDGVYVTGRVGHEPARYTTLDMLATEQRLINVATARARSAPTVKVKSVDAAIRHARRLGADQARRGAPSHIWRSAHTLAGGACRIRQDDSATCTARGIRARRRASDRHVLARTSCADDAARGRHTIDHSRISAHPDSTRPRADSQPRCTCCG